MTRLSSTMTRCTSVLIISVLLAGMLPVHADFKSLTEAKVEQTTISTSPNLTLYLPNGVIDVLLRNSIGISDLEYGAKYDYLNNFTNNRLDFRFNFPAFFVGNELYDEIDYAALYSDSNYLQKTRYARPYIGRQFSKPLSARLAVSFGQTVTVAGDSLITLDRGRPVLGIISTTYDDLDEHAPAPKGIRSTVSLKRSIEAWGSDYEYTQADATVVRAFRFLNFQSVKVTLTAGYPLENTRRPLSDTYYLGGYEILHGYGYREISGNAMAYTDFSYDVPLVRTVEQGPRWGVLEILTAQLRMECAKVGDGNIFHDWDNIRASMGIGMGVNFKLFKVLTVKANVLLAQPVDRRTPTGYFSLYAVTYTAPAKKEAPQP